MLLEAGPDYPSVAALPADVADGAIPTLVGGCSATNGGFWVRSWQTDYDGWAAAGNAGWTFEALLPVFRAVEGDADFADKWHGADGPVPVSRLRPEELDEYPQAFVATAIACGHPVVEDHNRPGALGVGPLPRNVRDGIRMGTALTHLAPARTRPNLETLADTGR